MSGEIIREANFLRGCYSKPIITSTVDVECVINLLFTHSDLYTFSQALTTISTLYMLDLITKQLYEELAKALEAVY